MSKIQVKVTDLWGNQLYQAFARAWTRYFNKQQPAPFAVTENFMHEFITVVDGAVIEVQADVRPGFYQPYEEE